MDVPEDNVRKKKQDQKEKRIIRILPNHVISNRNKRVAFVELLCVRRSSRKELDSVGKKVREIY